MKNKDRRIGRREFLKTVGAAGLGSAIGGAQVYADANEPKTETIKAEKPKLPQVSKRKLGRTGVEVSCLGLGVAFNTVDNQMPLIKGLEWGATYWDCAFGYAGGNSEIGIGKFLKRNPRARKKLFIVSKASGTFGSYDQKTPPTNREECLQESLKRMNTDYIDFYCGIHGVSDPKLLNDELRKWAKNAKKRGLIKFFGISTHKNIQQCLKKCAELGWIDVVMPIYNFRMMQDKKMQEAIEACHKAGIGIVAMKTQGMKIESDGDKKLVDHFLKRGFTEGQAKIKAVLADERISTACVGRDNVAHLMLNIAAVLDKTELTQKDFGVLAEYAKETCSGYCMGCGYICDEAVQAPYVSEIMRYMMYHNSYGERERARGLFAQIPPEVRGRLLNIDYSEAERRCPQGIKIGRMITKAVRTLT